MISEKNRGRLLIFFNSILQNVKNSKVIFFTENSYKQIPCEIHDIIHKSNGQIEVYNVSYLNLNLNHNTKRYFYYLDYINKNRLKLNENDVFLHCDNTDLVFLDNIFDKLQLLKIKNKINIFKEDKNNILFKCDINSWWINNIDNSFLKKIGNNVVINSGTIISDSLSKFIDVLTDISWYSLLYERKQPGKSYLMDQGILNCLIYHNKLLLNTSVHDIQLHQNEEPYLIYTMAHINEDDCRLVDRTLEYQNYTPCILHQYDRKPIVTKFVSDLFLDDDYKHLCVDRE